MVISVMTKSPIHPGDSVTTRPAWERRTRTSLALAMAVTEFVFMSGSAKIVSVEDTSDEPYIPFATTAPIPTASPSVTEKPRDCKPGLPETFSWPDLHIKDAPIEYVGDLQTPTGMTVDTPHGRDAKGAYNTVGFYAPGPKPGAEEGTPYFIAHSTQFDPSLLPREKTVSKLDTIRRLGKTTVISVKQDNGSTCKYGFSAKTGMLLEIEKYGKTNGYTTYYRKMSSLETGKENERPIFTFCTGEFDSKTGTSKNIAILQGKALN